MPKKILIVDDDPAVIHLLNTLLIKSGYEVYSAVDGLDALVKIKNIKPDLVILDVMMPEINGYDVCYQLRFNKDFGQISIVLVTVRDQELDEMIARRVNIEYIQKPINSKILLEKIGSLLAEKK